MDKFDEYLNNKIKIEKEEFVLPKSFEYKLEEALENLGKESKINNKRWYWNTKILVTAACFMFVCLTGISNIYIKDSNKETLIEKGLNSEDSYKSKSSPELVNYNEFKNINDNTNNKIKNSDLQYKSNDNLIDYSNINKIIIKDISVSNTYKAIDDKDNIKHLIQSINNIYKVEIQNQNINNGDFLIQTNGIDSNHSIIIENDIMNIDDKWYRIDSTEVNNLREIYNKLSYDAKDIPYCNY